MKLAVHPSMYLFRRHPVYKTSSNGTKVWALFTSSAIAKLGKSSNDLLLSGAKLQKPLPDLLIKFRRRSTCNV